MSKGSGGGGYGSKPHVTKPVRTGAPRERIRPTGVAQLGQRQGNHFTEGGAKQSGYGGVPIFGAGQGYASELGNAKAAATVCGPGGSRTVMKSGSQCMTGAVDPGKSPGRRDILSEFGPESMASRKR
jgi:hypothetical protein